MDSGSKRNIFLAIGGILAIIVAYVLFIKKSNKEVPTPTQQPSGGSSPTGLGGTIADVDDTPASAFAKGADVYLNPTNLTPGNTTTPYGVPVFKYPLADSKGSYLVGIIKPSWYSNKPIGKYVEQAGSTPFSKITLSNIDVWRYASGTYFMLHPFPISGDYFINNAHIQKTLY